MSHELYEEHAHVIETLRDAGFAVTIFNPDELAGADPELVADLMCQRGWDAIEDLKE